MTGRPFPSPWSMQVELVEGCQLRCKMCGINALPLRRDEYHFMPLEMAEGIAKDIARAYPRVRIEFAMHGEPLLHPEWPMALEVFRRALPHTQLMVSTNFLALRDTWPAQEPMLRSANIVIVDLYQPYGPMLKKRLIEWGRSQSYWGVVDFYGSDFSPWHNHGNKTHTIVLMDDILTRDGERNSRTIFNHAGSSRYKPALSIPLHKTCTLP